MMMSRRVLIGAIAGLAALAGWASAGPLAAEEDPAELSIGWVNVGAGSNQALMLVDKLVEQNLPNTKVKWVEFNGGSAGIAALNAGDIQIMTEVGLPPTVSSISKGLDFKIVWVNDIYLSSEGLVVRKTSNIQKIADLAGKKVATMVGTSSGYMLHAALASAGLDETKVEVINMDPPSMQAAWKRGELDAAYIWVPALLNMANDGGTILATNADFQDRASSIDMILVGGDFAKKYPGTLTKFLKAQNDSIHDLRTNGDAAMKRMADYLKISLDQAKTEYGGIQLMDAKEQLSEQGLGRGTSIATSRITKAITAAGEYLVGVGSIDSVPTNIPEHIDTAFIEALAK
jgi:taurine transport system substrate-binding protein